MKMEILVVFAKLRKLNNGSGGMDGWIIMVGGKTTSTTTSAKKNKHPNDIQLNQFDKFDNSLFGIRFSKYIHGFYPVLS